MLKETILIFSSALLVGCVGANTITPQISMVKKEKFFNLNNITLGKIVSHTKEKSVSGFITTAKDNYSVDSNNGYYYHLNYVRETVNDSDMYINRSAHEGINTWYKNQCKMEQIKNLYFMECNNNYYITESKIDSAHLIRGANSFVELIYVKIDDYSSFSKIRNIFKEK